MSEFNLDRFLKMPEGVTATAFLIIFPRIKGLGDSMAERHLAIESLEEAGAYLKHEKLGNGLIEVTNMLLKVPTNDISKVITAEDASIIHASMTLFSQVENAPDCFQEMLDRFFEGLSDKRTLDIIRDMEFEAMSEKYGVKPENMIKLDIVFDPTRSVDEQAEEAINYILSNI